MEIHQIKSGHQMIIANMAQNPNTYNTPCIAHSLVSVLTSVSNWLSGDANKPVTSNKLKNTMRETEINCLHFDNFISRNT